MLQTIVRGSWIRWGFVFTLAGALSAWLPQASAQNAVVVESGGRPTSPDQAKAMEAEARARAQAQGGQPQPNQEQKKEGEEKKEGEGGDKDKKEEGGGDSVKRPDKPPRVPDPREFEVTLDENGKVPQFSFIGQPWPDVMQWFATLSKSSFDFQELPTGYLNLTTQRSYTVEEVRDLINRHLLARGYVALQAGEMLSVVKVDKLDPSVIRSATEEDLYSLTPYDFAKVSFELPTGMEVDKAKEDIKQVLSPNAKVFPLVTTKRILVIDTVANLRMVSALLNEERMVQSGHVMPYQRVLKHARADQVIDILYVVLGMDPKSRPTQMDLQVRQKELEIMAQIAQRGTDVSKMLKQDGPPVYLAYNKQRNSVLANAPPEQLKIIDQTLNYLDVPFGGDGASGGENAVSQAAAGARSTKRHRLATLDPEEFIETLQEIGGLSPSAELRVDEDSKVLFAMATEADHVKIASLIADFDGTGREFHVIQLRRLPAPAVAETIFKLMAGQTQEKDNDRNRGYWWDYYDRGNDDDDEQVQGFAVDADIENNRLMLWADAAEREKVDELLKQLGEIPDGQVGQKQIRFIEPAGEKSPAELLRQLQDAWKAAGKNELIINLPEAPANEPAEEKDAEEDDEKPAKPASDRSAAGRSSTRVLAQYVQLGGSLDETQKVPVLSDPKKSSAEAADTTDAGPNPPIQESKAPPVTITVREDGRLMLSSADPAALDEIEELIGELSPPERGFQVYRLKYIPVVHMYLDLKDYFADELEEEESGYVPWWRRGETKKESSGLSKPRKLLITYDAPSKSILVKNASPSQTLEIEQLIKEFDQPPPSDGAEIRETQAIKIKFSKASVIANAVKEVYRDLLSTKDKEFERAGDQRQQGRGEQRATTVFFYGDSMSGNSDNASRSSIKGGFEGDLSIGVDEISNMLLISANQAIFADVKRMVEELDQQAAPNTTVHVHRVNGAVTAANLQKVLNQAMSKPWPGGRPEQQAARSGDGGGREGDDRGRNRDRRGRRDRDQDGNRDRDGDGGGGRRSDNNDND